MPKLRTVAHPDNHHAFHSNFPMNWRCSASNCPVLQKLPTFLGKDGPHYDQDRSERGTSTRTRQPATRAGTPSRATRHTTPTRHGWGEHATCATWKHAQHGKRNTETRAVPTSQVPLQWVQWVTPPLGSPLPPVGPPASGSPGYPLPVGPPLAVGPPCQWVPPSAIGPPCQWVPSANRSPLPVGLPCQQVPPPWGSLSSSIVNETLLCESQPPKGNLSQPHACFGCHRSRMRSRT